MEWVLQTRYRMRLACSWPEWIPSDRLQRQIGGGYHVHCFITGLLGIADNLASRQFAADLLKNQIRELGTYAFNRYNNTLPEFNSPGSVYHYEMNFICQNLT
jgi:hypothetical protein